MTARTCIYKVRRGGPSSGGGYDRMNRTRYETCGKPVGDSPWFCPRHLAVTNRRDARRQMRDEARRMNRQ